MQMNKVLYLRDRQRLHCCLCPDIDNNDSEIGSEFNCTNLNI